ncbi:MAG: exodeoxyribonuclease III [Chloroflexi bacterium]|nr:exodeoxyribonuclease III [Chloroflexota bacterium]
MLIATWNVNSLKARLPRVLEFLEAHQPDALCLQETKVTAEAFPHLDLQAAGYRAVEHSAGHWTGVAVLAREGVDLEPGAVRGLPGEPLPGDARWVEAVVDGVRVISVYVVNGRSLDDPMFAHKLAFLDAMERRLEELAGTPYVVTGDFNIAPADIDVYDPAAWEGSTHVTPEERGRLARLLSAGCVDAYRQVDPDGVHYTWWDYRQGAFHRGWGLRIDLALVSTDLAPRIVQCGIDREFRKGTKPSDHAPLLLELADEA